MDEDAGSFLHYKLGQHVSKGERKVQCSVRLYDVLFVDLSPSWSTIRRERGPGGDHIRAFSGT